MHYHNFKINIYFPFLVALVIIDRLLDMIKYKSDKYSTYHVRITSRNIIQIIIMCHEPGR